MMASIAAHGQALNTLPTATNADDSTYLPGLQSDSSGHWTKVKKYPLWMVAAYVASVNPATVTVGDPLVDGNPYSVVYLDRSGDFATDGNFSYNSSILQIGGGDGEIGVADGDGAITALLAPGYVLSQDESEEYGIQLYTSNDGSTNGFTIYDPRTYSTLSLDDGTGYLNFSGGLESSTGFFCSSIDGYLDFIVPGTFTAEDPDGNLGEYRADEIILANGAGGATISADLSSNNGHYHIPDKPSGIYTFATTDDIGVGGAFAGGSANQVLYLDGSGDLATTDNFVFTTSMFTSSLTVDNGSQQGILGSGYLVLGYDDGSSNMQIANNGILMHNSGGGNIWLIANPTTNAPAYYLADKATGSYTVASTDDISVGAPLYGGDVNAVPYLDGSGNWATSTGFTFDGSIVKAPEFYADDGTYTSYMYGEFMGVTPDAGGTNTEMTDTAIIYANGTGGHTTVSANLSTHNVRIHYPDKPSGDYIPAMMSDLPSGSVVSTADLTGQTTSTTVATYSVPAGSNKSFIACANLNISTISGSLTMYVNYTDDLSTVHNDAMLTGLSSAVYTSNMFYIRAKAGTNISFTTTLTGTATYNTGERIVQQ